jgi:hypothetical protein
MFVFPYSSLFSKALFSGLYMDIRLLTGIIVIVMIDKGL